MSTITILTVLSTTLAILNLILILCIRTRKKHSEARIQDLLPFNIGHIDNNNNIVVSMSAKLYLEGTDTCHTVYGCLNKFFKNPAKMLDEFYSSDCGGFGISLPISKVEGNKLFVRDLNGMNYRLVMKQMPSQIAMNLSSHSDDD